MFHNTKIITRSACSAKELQKHARAGQKLDEAALQTMTATQEIGTSLRQIMQINAIERNSIPRRLF